MSTVIANESKLVLIGLGSNLDAPASQIRAAISRIETIANTRLKKSSSLYESKPQGPQDQDNFINAVILIETTLTPPMLLQALQSIELAQGRIKTRHWGERVIDLDILFYGNETLALESPDLKIPHPHALTRDFVLIPACEIEPNWPLPDKSTLTQHLDHCLNHQLIRIESRTT
jgi:2-amino-4-hydroxy-6-hydroxymethyldihydropteridine diphosphokinase